MAPIFLGLLVQVLELVYQSVSEQVSLANFFAHPYMPAAYLWQTPQLDRTAMPDERLGNSSLHVCLHACLLLDHYG